MRFAWSWFVGLCVAPCGKVRHDTPLSCWRYLSRYPTPFSRWTHDDAGHMMMRCARNHHTLHMLLTAPVFAFASGSAVVRRYWCCVCCGKPVFALASGSAVVRRQSFGESGAKLVVGSRPYYAFVQKKTTSHRHHPPSRCGCCRTPPCLWASTYKTSQTVVSEVASCMRFLSRIMLPPAVIS